MVRQRVCAPVVRWALRLRKARGAVLPQAGSAQRRQGAPTLCKQSQCASTQLLMFCPTGMLPTSA